ncbi:MAG: MFS transporter [Candidatus Hydrogenedentota bacterium]
MANGQTEEFNRPGFWALIAMQFQGAFNDNSYRMLIVLFLPLALVSDDFPSTEIAFALFNGAYLIFPGLMGALSDRYSKQTIAIMTKYFEVVIMVMALVGFWLQSAWFLLFVLFLMGLQSAFFSPSKYGILPEILPEGRLPWGNGYMQMGTFVAIILGQALGGTLLDWFRDEIALAGLVLIGFTLAGLVCSYFITRPPAAEPDRKIPWNPWHGLPHYLGLFYADRWLFASLAGVTYFWFAGAFVMQNIVEYGLAMFGESLTLPLYFFEWEMGTGTQTGLLTATLSLGIAIGSVLSGYGSRKRIDLCLVPYGAFGLSLISILLAVPAYHYVTTLILMFLLGGTAGFFVVPLAAMLQHRCPETVRGGMIAAHNFVTFLGMTLAAGLFFLMHSVIGLAPATLFLLPGVMTLAVGLVYWYIVPYAPR